MSNNVMTMVQCYSWWRNTGKVMKVMSWCWKIDTGDAMTLNMYTTGVMTQATS